MNINKQRLIALISHAIKLANISVYLGLMAVMAFCVFGTLASMASFKDSQLIYVAFHYLPYVLIGFSVPVSVYLWWLLSRYKVVQAGILLLILATGVGGGIISAVFYAVDGVGTRFFMSVFLTMMAWFGMPYLFRVNLKKFLKFLQDTTTP
ncbi:hypothetical protein [Moraxella sp. VT-16-12]|uniref:hypothetical protein n=1 Tax=Moraxella sp. VT-16-12 TaxID=2014877 RepID=UPI000B7F3F6D|nr:hypothetical protein [Moraxella sp. VT-16-12]TWV82459.1 hypothetical protein CEW93_006015 [Moraxella sp. VT-16-12]